MGFSRSCVLAVTGWIAVLSLGSGTSVAQPPTGGDRAGKDYSAELPRLPLKSPAESRTMFSPRPGFSVELAAAEPLLRSPVAMDFDADGRLYVAEFPEYNAYASARPLGKGCVRLLEDSDDDGVFEKSTLFAEDLPMACAVACWDGGVLVGSPPDLVFLKDRDGDGKADLRRIVLTGFGRDRAGEAMINSIRWGLDNRFHISTGGDGGEIRHDPGSRTGVAARPIPVRNQNLLFDPRSQALELTGGGGQHGMTMDDWGRTYVCNNSDPFRLLAYDSRYLARNPHVLAPPALVSVAPEGKFTKLFRISPVEPWRILRTRLRREGVVPGSDEGGTPSGFFTGATGVTVYRGDAFPAEYRGNLFVGDVSNNIIHRAVAEPDGLLVTARPAEVGREFLASRDGFFRPVQMANAPDGCLWVIDMYRELIEGAAFLPTEILRHLDVGSGSDRGRIWRIVAAGTKRRAAPRLSKASTLDLVALLEHPNGWHRDTAARLLYERQDPSASPALERLASTSHSPLGRIHALFALSGLGQLAPDLVLTALGDREPKVREQALRLAEPLCPRDARIRGRLLAMSDDPDPRVRYQLAFSLGAVPGAEAVPTLSALARRDGGGPLDASGHPDLGVGSGRRSLLSPGREIPPLATTDTSASCSWRSPGRPPRPAGPRT